MQKINHDQIKNKQPKRNKTQNYKRSKEEVIMDQKYFQEIRGNINRIARDKVYNAMILHQAIYYMNLHLGTTSYKGSTPEDIIQDATIKILDGKRAWKKYKLNFEIFFMLVVISIIKNLANSEKDNNSDDYHSSKKPKFVPLEYINEEGEVDLNVEIKENLYQDYVREYNEEEDEWEILLNRFSEIIEEVKLILEQKDDIIALTVLEILLDIEIDQKDKTNQKIAEMLDVEVNEIVNAKKRIFRLIINKMKL